MKFTLSWLKDHLETEASLDEIVEKLTLIGLEVEEVANPGDRLAAFVIARVLEAKPHPDADKLRVCKVDFGAEKPIQVVCGAPNARTGMIGVFAPEGTYVPGTDLLLSKVKIRGVESAGMLCSERELELSDDHEGIIDLAPELAGRVGARYVDVVGLDDPVIDIAITPNRPDALGVYGVARDLAAAGLGKLKKPDRGYKKKGEFSNPIPISLNFPKSKLSACPVFAGRTVRGVKNVPSPQWMQQRLKAIGLRPINALVDVTNYISYDRGRPLHVYDADKLSGTIHARLGKKGEQFLALDGKTYEVDGEMTVIADDNGVLGLGGIMGGESTGCTLETTSVFIESAYFDPIRTARTGRRTNINSDARYRFERGVDPASVTDGVNLATSMIMEICGGTPSEMEIAGEVPDTEREIRFDTDEVKRLSGLKVKDSQIKKTLKSLGFKIDGKGEEIRVTPPSWRPDIHGSADLVEEVVRIVGINEVPSTPLERASGVARPVLTDLQRRVRLARRYLAARGLVEAVTWSFLRRDMARLFGGGRHELELLNPISSDLSSMRPSLLPGLISAAQRNQDYGVGDPALFEVGQIYESDQPEGQIAAAAGLRVATAKPSGSGRHWDGAAGEVDLFDAKADALGVLAALGLDPAKLQISREAPGWFHPGFSGAIKLGPKTVLGYFGVLHPLTLQHMAARGQIVGFELNLGALPTARKKATRAKPAMELSEFQSVRRDFAFVLEEDVPAGDVIRAARGADKKFITDVTVFDVFEGESVGQGKKSLAIEITLQPREKTLTDEEIDAIARRVIAQVQKSTGGQIRS